jgi:prolipoprotein diacylglyceryltransferase
MNFKKNLYGLITGFIGGVAGGLWAKPLAFEVSDFQIYGLILLAGVVCGLAGWVAGTLIDKLTELIDQKVFSLPLQLMIGAIIGIQLGFWMVYKLIS